MHYIHKERGTGYPFIALTHANKVEKYSRTKHARYIVIKLLLHQIQTSLLLSSENIAPHESHNICHVRVHIIHNFLCQLIYIS